MRYRIATICVVVGSLLAPPAGGAPPRGQVVTIDGDDFQGKLVRLDANHAVFEIESPSRKPATRRVARRDLLAVEFAAPQDLMGRLGQKVLVLDGGGELAVRNVSVAAEKITVETALMGRVTMGISSAAAFHFPTRRETPELLSQRLAAVKPERDGNDYLLAANDKGTWVPLTGGLEAIDDETVKFRTGDKERRISRSRVRVIQMVRSPGRKRTVEGSIIGADGSILPFSAVSFDGSKLTVAAEGFVAKAAIDLDSVAAIRFNSDRSVYVSEMSPTKVFQAGMFDVVFPFQIDRSTAGGPIRLGEKTYDRGLGLHSRCALAYELAGKFDRFAAVAGIDRAAGTRGNATLKLLGDGRELIKPIKLTGGSAGKPVRCSVAGVETLEIIVDFGDDKTDVGDHVVLAGARLIKP